MDTNKIEEKYVKLGLSAELEEFFATEDKVTSLPKMIRYKYIELQILYQEGRLHGCLLEAKDVLELLLKFPLVIMVCGLEQYANQDGVEKQELEEKYTGALKLLNELLKKRYSFGDWERMSSFFVKQKLEKLPFLEEQRPVMKAMQENLARTNELYLKFKDENGAEMRISNWRNDTLGHGATNSHEEELRPGIECILERIKAIIEASDYSGLEFIETETKMKVRLKTAENSEAGKVPNCGEIELDPYVFQLIYLFESFDYDKRAAFVLDYLTGKKNRNAALFKRLDKLCRKLDFKKGKNESAETEVLWKDSLTALETVLEEELLNNEAMNNKLKLILQEKGGVFLIEAPRGTGKSCFTEYIIRNPDRIKKLDKSGAQWKVFTHHFNSVYSSRYSALFTQLHQIYGAELFDEGYTLQSKEQKLRQAVTEGMSPEQIARAMGEYLGTIIKLYQERENADSLEPDQLKLLVFLDGIDEINTEDKQAVKVAELFHQTYIPENVYVVLTGRMEDEYCYDDTLDAGLTKKLVLNLDDKDYLNSLRTCLDKVKGYNTNELIKLADKRYLYVAAFRNLYNLKPEDFGNNMRKLAKQGQGGFIRLYLDTIQGISAKYCRELEQLLLLLYLVGEPITMKELAFFLNEDSTITFKFLGMLRDLQGFIMLQRNGTGGNTIALNNALWAKELESEDFAESLAELKQELSQRAKTILEGDYTFLSAGIEFSEELSFISRFYPEKEPLAGELNLWNMYMSSNTKAYIELAQNMTDMLEQHRQEKWTMAGYLLLGKLYEDLGQTLAAEQAYEAGVGAEQEYNILHELVLEYVHILNFNGKQKKALELVDAALHIYRQHDDRVALLRQYHILKQKGLIYRMLGDFAHAIKCTEEALKLLKCNPAMGYSQLGLRLSLVRYYGEDGRLKEALRLLDYLKPELDGLRLWENEEETELYLEYSNTLSTIYENKGEYQLALEAIEGCLQKLKLDKLKVVPDYAKAQLGELLGRKLGCLYSMGQAEKFQANCVDIWLTISSWNKEAKPDCCNMLGERLVLVYEKWLKVEMRCPKKRYNEFWPEVEKQIEVYLRDLEAKKQVYRFYMVESISLILNHMLCLNKDYPWWKERTDRLLRAMHTLAGNRGLLPEEIKLGEIIAHTGFSSFAEAGMYCYGNQNYRGALDAWDRARGFLGEVLVCNAKYFENSSDLFHAVYLGCLKLYQELWYSDEEIIALIEEYTSFCIEYLKDIDDSIQMKFFSIIKEYTENLVAQKKVAIVNRLLNCVMALHQHFSLGKAKKGKKKR